MWRVTSRWLAEAAGGSSSAAAAAAAGGGGAAATGGGTTVLVNGRLIRIRKKGKWIDRRSKRVPNNGKDVWCFGDQPSCALCHVRFRYKQDYETHKDSALHQNRLRWVETMAWWRDVGQPAYTRAMNEEWAWFAREVLPRKAREMGCSLEDARRYYRQATMTETPSWHRFLQCPPVRQEVKEPRDQRWPSSPKW